MSARDMILSRLRTAARSTDRPPAWRSRRAFQELAGQFTAALTANGGEVHRVSDLEGAAVRLETLLVELDARQIVANREPLLDTLNLERGGPHPGWQFPDASPSWKQRCATADVGITGALAAFAETGSVVISSGPGRSRLVSLLPPVHVALLTQQQITTDIFTWTVARQADWPANIVFVSGPSKTADIEQTLTVGVHGPRRFVVILLDV